MMVLFGHTDVDHAGGRGKWQTSKAPAGQLAGAARGVYVRHMQCGAGEAARCACWLITDICSTCTFEAYYDTCFAGDAGVVQVLAMLSLFGFLFGCIQAAIFEADLVINIRWDVQVCMRFICT